MAVLGRWMRGEIGRMEGGEGRGRMPGTWDVGSGREEGREGVSDEGSGSAEMEELEMRQERESQDLRDELVEPHRVGHPLNACDCISVRIKLYRLDS